jgi:hypothetical protein
MAISIQVNNNGYLDLFKREFVGLNYQIFDLKNIQTRQGAFSNDFIIPNTAYNQALLGYATAKNIADPEFSPTVKIPAKVFQNNILISNGFIQINEYDKDEIDIAFYGDNVDIFELLRGKKLVDAGDDLSDLRHVYSAANVHASFTNQSGYIYLPIDYGLFTTRALMEIDSGEIMPHVYIPDLLEAIFKGIGYKIAGTMLNRALYKKSVIAFTNELFGYTKEFVRDKSFYVNNKGEVADSIASGATVTYNFKHKETNYFGFEYGNTLFDLSSDKYTADTTVNMSMMFVYDAANAIIQYGTGFVKPTHYIKVNGVVVATGAGGNAAIYTGVINAGDYIEFDIKNNDPSPMRLYATANGEVSQQYADGTVIYPETLLPDMLQVDFIKWILFRFASVITIDQFSKTVYFNQFNDLNNNEVDNWSSKVDLSKKVTINYNELVGNYSKINTASYQEDDSDQYISGYNSNADSVFGSGAFEIDNDFINSDNEIYQAPFAGTMLIQSFDTAYLLLPYIPRNLVVDSINIPQPRVLTVHGVIDIDRISTVSSISILGISTDSIPFSYFYKSASGVEIDNSRESLAFGVQNIFAPNDMGAFESDYLNLINVFNNPEIVTAYLKLNQIDITNLDFLKKKYIERFGGYYYLNKIEDYDGSGDSVKCELIKL